MIVGLAGITAASGGEGIPPAGTILAVECVNTLGSVIDYFGNPWNGLYTEQITKANGSGSIYYEYNIGGGFCYLPAGFVIGQEGEYADYYLYWDDGEGNNGSFIAGMIGPMPIYADGTGGTYTQGSEISWSYPDGYVINQTTTKIVILKHNGLLYPNYYIVSNPSCPDAGTKSGTPIWFSDSSGGLLLQAFNDGYCGLVYYPWDGTPPYPTNGTTIGEFYSCDNTATDAIGNVFTNVCGYLVEEANNYPSYITSFSIAVTSAPDGWYFTIATIQYNFFDTSYVIYSYPSNNPVNPYLYGYRISDGAGGVYISSVNAPNGTALSTDFEYYDSENEVVLNGRIVADGSGGYYFQSD